MLRLLKARGQLCESDTFYQDKTNIWSQGRRLGRATRTPAFGVGQRWVSLHSTQPTTWYHTLLPGLFNNSWRCGPIWRINSAFYTSMERRIRPIRNFCHITVFYRIVMNVIEMALVIDVIPDQMLPIPALPYTPFVFALSTGGNTLSRNNVPGKMRLDQPPT